MVESFSFEEDEIQLEPGDLLVMYSDGITEAMNSTYEQFGRDHLNGLLSEQRRLALDELIRKIVDEVKMHAAGAPQSDDITLVAVRRVQ
jgi:sigma-B regulation protein RsbU (phosphoserine phosphatase)